MSDDALIDNRSPSGAAVMQLPAVLLRAYAEIQIVLRSLRASRDALDHAAVQKLQHTSAKLLEVSSATEVAATGILDSLDRATAMVDELDALDPARGAAGAEIRNRLRDELFQSISCLQFQDITTQQLRYASSILDEVEQRMADLARALDPAHLGTAAAMPEASVARTSDATFAPGATIKHAAERQSMADNIFSAAS
ncbi:MAG: hypothetical protein C0497_03250 [Gemmatimonas sp.]|nr:hypothetical protein [Gemmatimonas sp.]